MPYIAPELAPLSVLPCTIFVELVSSTSGDRHFVDFGTLFRQPPHRDWGRTGTAGIRSTCGDNELGP
jgi:hypothetical protein